MSLLAHRAAAATPVQQYDALAAASARLVIARYSSSFGLASRFLEEPTRTHVCNIYALVRIADEIVDAPRPGSPDAERRALLEALETETLTAMQRGHSANLVVHAFARTAARCGIGTELVTPFFDSMATDLVRTEHDRASLEAYVYGSAEVVGLMCLRVFVAGLADREAAYDALAPGARRLGAAFQKLNFLRDLAADHRELGRSYVPGLASPDQLSETWRDELLDDIDADLRAAGLAVTGLPPGSRRAVSLAHSLFAELSDRLRQTPVERLRTERVRVPGVVKARLAARQLLRGGA